MPISYDIAVDWARDASFTTSGDNVTNRIISGTPVTVRCGRDQARALSPATPGESAFELYNDSRDYSPGNASSPLYPNVLPKRPVRIQMTLSPTTYTVHRGKFDEYAPQRGAYSSVSVTALDGMADFGRTKLSTPLYQGLRTGAAIALVLDAAGWPAGSRDLDTGATVMPWWWEEGTAADEALTKLLDSEGPPALLYVDPATGNVVFRDRHHRLIRTASDVSQATLRDSGTDTATAVRFSLPMEYSQGWKDVVNSVTFPVDERRPQSALSEVWTTEDVFSLGVSEVRTFIVQAADPFLGAVVPVLDTDYTILAGGLASVTLSRTSGLATTITLTATAAGATVQGLMMRAYSVPVVRTTQVTRTDSASIAAYDLAAHGGDVPWAGIYDAAAIAELILIHRAQPLHQIGVRLRNGNDFISGQQLTRALSDRVTVSDTGTPVAGDFYVERIEHSIRGQKAAPIVETVLGCEQVPAGLMASPFILGTSLLNGADTLAY